jgi:hypothetical protein
MNFINEYRQGERADMVPYILLLGLRAHRDSINGYRRTG